MANLAVGGSCLARYSVFESGPRLSRFLLTFHPDYGFGLGLGGFWSLLVASGESFKEVILLWMANLVAVGPVGRVLLGLGRVLLVTIW